MSGTLSKLHYGAVGAGVCSLLLSFFPSAVANHPRILSPLLNLSWGVLFGAGLWQGGIAGRILFRFLPRHTVGRVQAVSFSILYDISTVMSGCLLVSTVGLAPQNLLLRIGATTSLLASILNSAFLSWKTVEAMEQKFAIEEQYRVGVSMEEPEPSVKEALESDPDFAAVRRRFAAFHSVGMTAALVGFCGVVPYLFA